MIIFLYGTDIFRSRQQLHEMKGKFKKDRDPQGLNVVQLDLEKEAPEKIMGEILAAPFLAERRMVVLENLLISKHKDLQEELLKRIREQTLPESNVVVFWEGTDKFKTKLGKSLMDTLAKEKFSQHFEEMKGVKLTGWIGTEFKDRGGKIGADAVQYLAQHAGHNMWRLNSLIDQLVAYTTNPSPPASPSEAWRAGGPYEAREITVPDIQLFLEEKEDDNIFNLVDALVGKQTKNVYKMIQEQYRIGEDVQFIFAMVLRQFRILLEIRDLYEREKIEQSNVLADRLGLHPFVVKKSLPMVRRYSLQQLSKIYEELLDLDRDIKTGKGSGEMLLDVFVGRVCATSDK